MIKNEELLTIYGGSKVVIGGVIIGIIVFFIGIIDGYYRPLGCDE